MIIYLLSHLLLLSEFRFSSFFFTCFFFFINLKRCTFLLSDAMLHFSRSILFALLQTLNNGWMSFHDCTQITNYISAPTWLHLVHILITAQDTALSQYVARMHTSFHLCHINYKPGSCLLFDFVQTITCFLISNAFPCLFCFFSLSVPWMRLFKLSLYAYKQPLTYLPKNTDTHTHVADFLLVAVLPSWNFNSILVWLLFLWQQGAGTS